MATRLTNPDGSYFDAPDEDTVFKKEPEQRRKGWWQDPNGWWKNYDPDRAWDPTPADVVT